MKYDFSKCNNLQFKAKDDEGEVMTGYLKVTKEGEECVVYVFPTDIGGYESYDRGLQLVIRDYERSEIIEDFSVWAEEHDLEIVPRDPETYTDWKVGDKVKHNINDHVSTIIAVLGEAIILSKNPDISVTALATAESLTKYNKLVLTDYEQELLKVRGKKACPFKEGDKVLVKDTGTFWRFDKFRFYNEGEYYPYVCFSAVYRQCIPLNERTWKLLGTTDEYKEEE